MKKIFSFLLFGVLSLFIYASGITIGGKTYAVDTIVHSHDIGPGTKYAFYDIPAYPLKFHVMEVDLTNPYVDIETCLSGDKAVATETPSSMSARNNRPGHEVLGATNGDFYQFQDPIEIGIPRSGQYRRGECVTNPVGRASFVLTPDRVPYIDRVNFAGTVRSGDNSHRLHAVNMQRLEWETETAPNFMLLYTNAYGTETHATTGGTKVMLHAKEGELFSERTKHRVRCRFGFRQSGHIAYSRTKSGLIRSRHSRNLFEKPLGRRRTDCLFRYRSCLDSGFADRLQGTNGRKRPHHIEKRSPGRRMGRRTPQNMHGYFAG